MWPLACGDLKARIDKMPQLKSALLAFALLAAILLAPGTANAQTCWLSDGPTIVNFGIYDPGLGTPSDSTGMFTFDCSNGSARATLSLSVGAGTYTTRQMVLGGDRLDYNLYRDAARTQIWGDGTAPSSTWTNIRRRTPMTIYGRIPAGQFPAAGNYADTITLTILY